MPVMIEDLSTSLDVQDQDKLRELVRREVENALRGRGAGLNGSGPNPADPGAGGKPLEPGR
jgi:hypothetical protein